MLKCHLPANRMNAKDVIHHQSPDRDWANTHTIKANIKKNNRA